MYRGSRHSRQNYRLISRPQNFHLSLLVSLAKVGTASTISFQAYEEEGGGGGGEEEEEEEE